jgi:D-arabinitol dehydrogenase (NADP+)
MCTNVAQLQSQLIPGHEAIGSIVKMGKNVKGFSIGDRCVADVGITVSWFWHSHR